MRTTPALRREYCGLVPDEDDIVQMLTQDVEELLGVLGDLHKIVDFEEELPPLSGLEIPISDELRKVWRRARQALAGQEAPHDPSATDELRAPLAPGQAGGRPDSGPV